MLEQPTGTGAQRTQLFNAGQMLLVFVSGFREFPCVSFKKNGL